MKYFFLALSIAFFSPVARAAEEKFAGKTLGAYLGSDIAKSKHFNGYSILINAKPNFAIVPIKWKKRRYVLFAESKGKSDPAKPNLSAWLIVDSIPLPQLEKGEDIQLGCSDPSKENEFDLIATAYSPEEGEATEFPAKRAWKANAKTKKIEAIPATGIVCEISGD